MLITICRWNSKTKQFEKEFQQSFDSKGLYSTYIGTDTITINLNETKEQEKEDATV